MHLREEQSSEEKRRWKIVLTDSLTDLPVSDIIYADDSNGECKVVLGGEVKNLSFGPRGIKIVRR